MVVGIGIVLPILPSSLATSFLLFRCAGASFAALDVLKRLVYCCIFRFWVFRRILFIYNSPESRTCSRRVSTFGVLQIQSLSISLLLKLINTIVKRSTLCSCFISSGFAWVSKWSPCLLRRYCADEVQTFRCTSHQFSLWKWYIFDRSALVTRSSKYRGEASRPRLSSSYRSAS